MAITNYLVHFKTEATYESNKSQLRNDAVAFVKDATIIHTHGTDYYCGSGPVALESDLANYATTSALTSGLASKADTSHTHSISQISGLQGELDSKLESVSLADLGVTATATELNYVDGVTSNIQTQLNGKAALIDLPEDSENVYLLDLTALGNLGVSSIEKNIGTDAYTNLVNAINNKQLVCVSVLIMTLNTIIPTVAGIDDSGTILITYSNMESEYNFTISSDGNCSYAYTEDSISANKVTGLSTVATSGSYNDLSDKPEIPDVSELATKSELSNYLPLTGGTLTGVLTLNGDSSSGNVIELDNDNVQSFNIVNNSGKNVNIKANTTSLSVTGTGVVISGMDNNLITLKGSGKNQIIYSNSPITISCWGNRLKISDTVDSLTFNDYVVLTEDNYQNYITSGDNVYYIDCSSFTSSSSDVSAISTALGGFQNFLDAVKAGKIICDRTDHFEEVTPNGTNVVYSITSALADSTWTFTLIGAISGSWVILEISFDRLFTTASIKRTLIERDEISASNTSSKSFLVGVNEQSDSAKSYSNANVYMQSGQLYATQMNATNGFYETSDARLKNFKDDIKALDVISEIPTKYFTWKKDETDDPKLHIGTSAQEIQKIYPDLVTENEEGELSVDYARLSVIALAAIKELKKEINELKFIKMGGGIK